MTGSKRRWRIADLMNRLPGQCWADLVGWVLGDAPERSRLPWRPISSMCRQDAARTGCCYCGKIGDQAPRNVGGKR
jgi:hypothetical protein